jgi:hypothetical protein
LGVIRVMRSFITIAILVAGVVLFLLSRSKSYLVMDRKGFRARIMTPSSVSVSQIPSVFDQLKAAHKDASWAVFVFCPAGEPASDQTVVNLQYSVANGAIGLDWVLLSPRNIADKDKIAAFIKERHYTVSERELNGVRFLRVEDGGLVQLGMQIVGEFYHLQNDSQMEFNKDGFEWRP